ncbi:MAG TPA: WYL domain-containing protein, partial [Candidatus Acidoferrales bacterium]|nr:WYL domain-containing protein [Candidatus Acidoferrales bacterium]
FKAKPSGLIAGEKRVRALMAELLKSYGEPMRELAEALPASDAGDADGASFVHFVQPQLIDGSAVREVFDALYAAWQNDARVEFAYKNQQRRVEPAAAVVRSGRYYLVGRDVEKGRDGWRTFAMDLIGPPIRRVGTFARKPAPAKYLSTDTIGFFKGDGQRRTVAVTFSKALAASAASRKWQDAQKIRTNPDGTITISFDVDDAGEVVRWALGFGDEAWVSAPPAVVESARELLDRIRRRYDR